MGLFSLSALFHTALFSFLLSRAPSFLLPGLSPGPAASLSCGADLLARTLAPALGGGTPASVGTRAPWHLTLGTQTLKEGKSPCPCPHARGSLGLSVGVG